MHGCACVLVESNKRMSCRNRWLEMVVWCVVVLCHSEITLVWVRDLILTLPLSLTNFLRVLVDRDIQTLNFVFNLIICGPCGSRSCPSKSQ